MSPDPAKPSARLRLWDLPRRLPLLWRGKGVVEQASKAWPGRGTGQAVLLVWRVRLVMLAISVTTFPLMTALLIGLFVFRSRVLGSALLGLLAIFMAGQTMLQAANLRLVLKVGGWSTRGATPVRRAQQPGRFWTFIAASGVITAFYAAAAGFLLWILITLPPYSAAAH